MMLLTTVSKIKKVWTGAFVPRLLRGDQRCTPVSNAVLRKAHKSTNTSDDSEDDKKKKKHGTNYEYIFMARKEPQLEREINTNGGDNVLTNKTKNIIEDTISPVVSPPVLTKETQVEKCQRLIEQAFGKPKHKKQVIDVDEEDEVKLKFEEETKPRETQVEKCQRIIEKAFGRQKPKKQVVEEPYYCTDVDIDQTRREIREAQEAKLDDDSSVDKPVIDDRVQFGVYRKSRVESSKKDILILPLEAQNVTNDEATLQSTAKKGGTKEPATITDHFDDLNLMQRTLNIYLAAGKENDDNMTENTLQHEKQNLIRTDGKIEEAEDALNPTTSKENQHFMYYDSVDDTLPLKQCVLEGDIDKYVQKQEKMEDKLFCDMEHMYENPGSLTEDNEIFKKSETIRVKGQTVKFNSDVFNELKPFSFIQYPPYPCPPLISRNVYSRNYWLQELEERKSEITSKENVETYDQNEEQIEKNLDNEWILIKDKKTPQVRLQSATTAKDTEEQLTQKIEHIDETPLVEAHKPKIEGFNVIPRVLGEMDPSFDSYTDKKTDKQQTGTISRVYPTSYDEVAKRCLDTPTGKIDEILLKEIERLEIPSRRDSSSLSPVVEDDLVQIAVQKKQPKHATEKKGLELESQVYERAIDKLFVPRNIYSERQTVKCNKEPQLETNYEVISPKPKFVIHPHQVLIDPFDKKTIGQDTEEYDGENFYDPTLAYVYEPEKKKGTSLLGKANSPINKSNSVVNKPKVNKTSDQYDDIDMQETHKVYSKRIDKTPSSEARKMMTNNNKRGEEQSNPRDSKYEHDFTSSAVDKTPPFSPNKTCGTHNMWYGQQFSPHLPNYIQERMATMPGGTHNSKATQGTPEKLYLNYNRAHEGSTYAQDFTSSAVDKTPPFNPNKTWRTHNMWYGKQFSPQSQNYIHERMATMPGGAPNKAHEGYPNTMGSTSRFYMSDGTLDKFTHLRHNVEHIKRTNMKISDGLWDEQSLEEHFVAPELKTSKVNRKWNQEHVQCDGSLTCNATHFYPPPRSQWNQGHMQPEHSCNSNAANQSPRPQVEAGESCRIVESESKYEQEQEVFPKCQLDMPHEETGYEEKMKKVASFLQADAIRESTKMDTIAMNSANLHAAGIPVASIPETLNNLPKLNEAVSLTELLRRVRERSRIIDCKNDLKALGIEVDPIEGKCGGKAPRCSPLPPRAQPMNPLPHPSFGLPQLKPRPPACKPKRKPRSNKCSSCEMDMSLGLRLGPQVAQVPIVCSEMVCEMNVAGAMEVSLSRSSADLTDDIIDRLQALGKILGGALRQGKTDVLESAVVKHRRGSKVMLAKDYKPWAPIPSWPTPKKQKPKDPVCSPGCKVFPPTRATLDPPCDPQPCQGFPKKSFAVLDCFAVSLGENKVYDLGEF